VATALISSVRKVRQSQTRLTLILVHVPGVKACVVLERVNARAHQAEDSKCCPGPRAGHHPHHLRKRYRLRADIDVVLDRRGYSVRFVVFMVGGLSAA